ncbi:MAG: hypothetical protein LBS83_02255 [Holosporales bacterium]|jgi:hypothetical protein|nr:hypothetical protein [Holosporales bacterium]
MRKIFLLTVAFTPLSIYVGLTHEVNSHTSPEWSKVQENGGTWHEMKGLAAPQHPAAPHANHTGSRHAEKNHISDEWLKTPMSDEWLKTQEIGERLRQEIGDTAILQHSAILTAIIGDRKLRPQISLTVSSTANAFSKMIDDLNSLIIHVNSIPEEYGASEWREEHFAYEAPIMRQFRKLQTEFDLFLESLYHGSVDEIITTVNKMFNNENEGLVGRLVRFSSLFEIGGENNRIGEMLDNLPNSGTKHIAKYLFMQVFESILKVKYQLFLSKDSINQVLESSEGMFFDDVVSKLDTIKKDLNTLSEFFSLRPKS